MPHLSSNHPDPDIRQRSNELLKAAGYTTDDSTESNASSSFERSSTSTSDLWDFVRLVLFLIFIIGGALCSFKYVQEERNAAFEKQAAQVGDMIPGLIQNLEVRGEPSSTKIAPVLVWRGKDMTVLKTTMSDKTPSIFSFSMGRDAHDDKEWTTIGTTKKGRYFSVTHLLSGDCDEESWKKDCLSQGRLRELTFEQFKHMIYQTGDAALFEKTFGEKMPPNEIPA